MISPSIGIFYIYDNDIIGLPIGNQVFLQIFKANRMFKCTVTNIWDGTVYVAKYKSENVIEGWVEK